MHRGDPSSTDPSYSYSIKSSAAERTPLGPSNASSSRMSCGCINVIFRSSGHYSLCLWEESTRGPAYRVKAHTDIGSAWGQKCLENRIDRVKIISTDAARIGDPAAR